VSSSLVVDQHSAVHIT